MGSNVRRQLQPSICGQCTGFSEKKLLVVEGWEPRQDKPLAGVFFWNVLAVDAHATFLRVMFSQGDQHWAKQKIQG